MDSFSLIDIYPKTNNNNNSVTSAVLKYQTVNGGGSHTRSTSNKVFYCLAVLVISCFRDWCGKSTRGWERV